MTIIVPDDSLDGLATWMMDGPWPEHLDEAVQDHIHAYCSQYSINSLDELSDEIGVEWVTNLIGIALHDFLSRETEDGNVVDRYLKKRAHKERSVAKAYMRGIRNSVMSLFEITEMRPDKCWMVRDLILGGDPILVEENSTNIKSAAPGNHMAMRVAEVRGHQRIAGGVLPYDPDLSEQVMRAIRLCAEGLASETWEEFGAPAENTAEKEAMTDLTLALVLKLSAPVFSFSWLAGSVPTPDEIKVLAFRQFTRMRLRA